MTIYSIQAGNTLSGIAKANNMSLKQLLDLNPELKSNPDKIQVGQKIKLDKNTSIFPSRQNSSAQKQQAKAQQPQVKQQTAQSKPQAAQTNKKQEKPLSYGRFYTGMTADEAKKQGLYNKSFLKVDFQDFDTDKDGKISDKEMLKYRDREAVVRQGAGIVNTFLTFGITPDLTMRDYKEGSKIAKENKEYRKQHNIK